MEVRKTTVIICEGSVTEPNYFHGLANLINRAEGRERIIIKPKPPLLREAEIKAANEEFERAVNSGEIPRTGRKRRQTAEVENEPEIVNYPEGYSAQPVNYVWQAKEDLKIHEEAWAVFDLDGHAEQEKAFEIANELVMNKKVDLAFSSISFETWILMHFELCDTAFKKSQCRTKKGAKKILHDCGQGTNIKDCHGTKCTTGYMKIKGHLPKVGDVKHTSYDTLKNKTFVAIENSLRLRDGHGNPLDCFRFNPITTVDRLVFKLLYIKDDYKWITKTELKEYHLSYTRSSATLLRLTVYNNTGLTRIIKPNFFQLCNLQNERKFLLERRIQEKDNSFDIEIDLNMLLDFDPKFLVLDKDDTSLSIIELQCLL